MSTALSDATIFRMMTSDAGYKKNKRTFCPPQAYWRCGELSNNLDPGLSA
jgi:hypothetical protein